VNADRPVVLCLVGTDHHPFDRVVGWCDEIARDRPDVQVLVQHGSTAAPRVAEGVAFLGKEELTAQLAAAHVAICHGGPGLISDVRDAGLLPLVVARDPVRGEHVDGHQQRFVARFAQTGAIQALDDLTSLRGHVDELLALPRGAGRNTSAERERVDAAVQRFGDLVEARLAIARQPRRRR
jgi:UDP-N-acetylglucosamine transferase subunit ALG13